MYIILIENTLGYLQLHLLTVIFTINFKTQTNVYSIKDLWRDITTTSVCQLFVVFNGF